MYLSCLLINVGSNPDQQDWRNRNWLRNIYRVHQRLAMAFPADPSRKGAALSLKPFSPDDFPDQKPADEIMDRRADVNEERSEKEGFLYRIDYGVPMRKSDPDTGALVEGGPSRPVILVQSAKEPNWDYAFGLDRGALDPATGRPVGNAGHLLAAPPCVKLLHIKYRAGDLLRFRLNANPTRRLASGPFKGRRVSVGRGKAAVLGWLWHIA